MTIEDGHKLYNLEQVNPPRIVAASFEMKLSFWTIEHYIDDETIDR